MYHIKDIRFPILDTDAEKVLAVETIDDIFGSYIFFDDRYDEETVDLCDTMTPEGLYGLVNDRVNVTVMPGDIVIDAGSWIGDFAAYASVKGATTYAFEPTDSTFAILQETAQLNGNIIPVKKGLSDESANIPLFESTKGSTSFNSFMSKTEGQDFSASYKVETVRLDDFVRENNLPRIDFIKADIEGFERRMLAGAQETLARFAPKLALCTYHLPDDPQVMAELIMQANPKYHIVQKRKKLFASVPQE
ncbi:MAG: FkbM family methyltransferase [Synergistaceae bacterium]|nr:FkbM family methyltransferase [Synergistaceae bacterium]